MRRCMDMTALMASGFLGRAFVALLFGCAALIAGAQSAPMVGGGPSLDAPQIHSQFPDKTVMTDSQPEMTGQMRRVRLLNAARQKAMISDADKLLALARELNGDMAAGGKSVPPADRMHMIAEIEKLAHSVKEKMSFVWSSEETPRNNLMNSWPQ